MATPWPKTPPTPQERAAYAASEPRPFWASRLTVADPAPPLTSEVDADLCIVGAGFTGLWAALHALHEQPGRDVVILESQIAGFGASSRNGGFVEASLTHGLANGLARFASEMSAIEQLAAENFAGLKGDVERHGIDCDWSDAGEMTVMLEPHQVPWAAEEAEQLRAFGYDVEVFPDAASVQAQVGSPLFQAGVWQRSGAALVDPGKLVAGLRRAALAAGARLHEHTPVEGLREEDGRVHVITPRGRVRARKVLLATSAYPSLVRTVRRRVVPVYDYVLMTEPLSAAQWAQLGWAARQGLSDAANQFHYFRPTAEGRILWGGYDAVYRAGGPVGAHLDEHEASFAKLSQHFFTTFPQLRGLQFTHRWGGPIDTCSRFSAFFGTELGGKLSYVAGYTGLGVGASRFGAQVALDLVDRRQTAATALRLVQERPMAFPPEPVRSAVVAFTQRQLAAADEREGRRGPWLGLLDRLGLGFDS